MYVKWMTITLTSQESASVVARSLSNSLVVAWNIVTLVPQRPAFFYTKAFVYNSLGICLIMTKLLHHTV